MSTMAFPAPQLFVLSPRGVQQTLCKMQSGSCSQQASAIVLQPHLIASSKLQPTSLRGLSLRVEKRVQRQALTGVVEAQAADVALAQVRRTAPSVPRAKLLVKAGPSRKSLLIRDPISELT